jgi:hypothetical protein
MTPTSSLLTSGGGSGAVGGRGVSVDVVVPVEVVLSDELEVRVVAVFDVLDDCEVPTPVDVLGVKVVAVFESDELDDCDVVSSIDVSDVQIVAVSDSHDVADCEVVGSVNVRVVSVSDSVIFVSVSDCDRLADF